MSDLKLFKLDANQVTERSVSSMALEKSLQILIEKHLDTFLRITFRASEYSTGPKTGGRMDTLGIDENGAPVIIEYKKATNANVINQGLFCLDWLLDHRGDFELMVTRKLEPIRRRTSIGAAPACSASPAIFPNTTSTPSARCSATSS
jgi:glutathionylspermidine synthase